MSKKDKDRGAVNRAEIIKLRVQGYNFREIAEKVGLAVSTTFEHYTNAMAEIREQTRESADEVRSVEIDRLDRMIRALENKAFVDEDPRAIETLLKVSDRRAKLLGLDAPEDLNVNIGEVSPEMAAQKVREKFGDHAAKKRDSGDDSGQ